MVRLPPIVRRWLTLLVVFLVALFFISRIIDSWDYAPVYTDDYDSDTGVWEGILNILRSSQEEDDERPVAYGIQAFESFQWSLASSRRAEVLPLSDDERTIQTNLRGWDFSEFANPPRKKFDVQTEERLEPWKDPDDKPEVKKNLTIRYPVQNRFPIIIWWTPFTGQKHVVRRCGRGRCLFTHNRGVKDHTRTRAFMWYGTDLRFRDLPLPRRPKHDWALLHEESPKNNWPIVHEPVISLFNHTCTFRRESSYPITLQYLPSMEYLMARPRFDIFEKNRLIKEEGLAPVLYVQSDCDVPSDRDRYVRKLMKYIRVDSLGKCEHNRDLPAEFVNPLTMDDNGFHQIIARYKFAVTFENAICNDYMTEKLWRPLSLGSVPIYRGSPSVQDWMPNNHTLILADDFPSIEALADYLKYLDGNDDKYARYFEFKDPEKFTNFMLSKTLKERPWGVDDYTKTNFIDGFECHVCDRVYEELLADAKSEKPLSFQANQSHYGCPRPSPAVAGMDVDFNLRTWIDEYEKSSSIIAAATKRMVESGVNSSRQLNHFIEEVYSDLKSNNFDEGVL